MRLIDADKLYPDCLTKEGTLAISQSQIANTPTIEELQKGWWIITAEDNAGIHRIQCPFCRFEKGSECLDYITVTFEKLPPFCESCGAELRGGE